MKDILLMFLLLASVCAAGFCAGVETGFLSVSRVRLLSLVRQGSTRARRLAKALGDMSRVVTTLLVGNNLAAVTVSTVSAVLALRLFSSSPLLQTGWTLFVAALMLFVGEYLPKLLFATRPLRRSLSAMRAYRLLEVLLAPLVGVFAAVTRVVFKVRPMKSGRLGVSRFADARLRQGRLDPPHALRANAHRARPRPPGACGRGPDAPGGRGGRRAGRAAHRLPDARRRHSAADAPRPAARGERF